MRSGGSPSSLRTLLTKVLEGTVRASILASAVYAGVWLGIRPHGCNRGPAPSSRLANSVQMRQAVRSAINVLADSNVAPNSTPPDFRRIGADTSATPERNDPAVSPAALGSGVADVFAPDGRLILRFSAIERPNGQWEVVEYHRLPVDDTRRELNGRAASRTTTTVISP